MDHRHCQAGEAGLWGPAGHQRLGDTVLVDTVLMSPFPPSATCVLPMNAADYYAIQDQPAFRSLLAQVPYPHDAPPGTVFTLYCLMARARQTAILMKILPLSSGCCPRKPSSWHMGWGIPYCGKQHCQSLRPPLLLQVMDQEVEVLDVWWQGDCKMEKVINRSGPSRCAPLPQ